MEMTSIQWSGGSIAALAFCLLGFLIWLSVMWSSGRGRKEQELDEVEVPNIKHAMNIGKTYRVVLKSQPILERVTFVGRSGKDWNDPLHNLIVFARPDGAKVCVRAQLILLFVEV